MRKLQWRRTLVGFACVLAILGILVFEGLRRHEPDALARAIVSNIRTTPDVSSTKTLTVAKL
ncbi:MAG: hypothetical protein AABX89_01705 [Candidatus Thermoplasmatota archaeon]